MYVERLCILADVDCLMQDIMSFGGKISTLNFTYFVSESLVLLLNLVATLLSDYS